MKILISKSIGKIIPKPQGTLAMVLEQELSYKKQGSEFMPNPKWGIVRLYKIKSGTFPIGFINKVIAIIKQWQDYKNEEIRLEIENLNMKESKSLKLGSLNVKLRDYQLEAVDKFLLHQRGILSLATGLGKTITAIEIIRRLGIRTLVLVHTTELVDQWRSVILKQLNYESGIYRNGKHKIKDITVANVLSIHKNKELLEEFDLIIFDECHHIPSDIAYKIGLELKQKYVLGLSATPYRNDGEEMKIQAVLGDILITKSLRWGIKNGYLCPAKVIFYEIDDEYDKTTNKQKYPEIYERKIVNNEKRNKLIAGIASTTNNKTLILVNHIDHGNKLLEELKEEDVIFLNGKSKERDKNHRIIIATSIFDEGVDMPDIHTIILAGGGSSSIKTVQRIGRVLRPYKDKEYAMIIDFIDRSKYLYNHYLERKKIYDEELL